MKRLSKREEKKNLIQKGKGVVIIEEKRKM